jgi:hypothetical protein
MVAAMPTTHPEVVAMAAANGGGNGGNLVGNIGNHGGNGGHSSSFQQAVFYQLYGKEGHSAIRCFKQFNRSWNGPPQKSASSTTNSYGVGTNWYMYSGATNHTIGELYLLSICDKYTGGDHIHAANGSGMRIDSVGNNILQ